MDQTTRNLIEATWSEGDADKIRKTLILLHSLGLISDYERNYYGDRLAEATARRPAPGEAVRRLLQPPTASSRPTTTVGRGPLAVRVETPENKPQLTYVENAVNAEIQAYRKKPTERGLSRLRYMVAKIEDPRLREFYERKLGTLPAPEGAPEVAEWAMRAEAERAAQPQQASVSAWTKPQNILRAMDVPRGFLAGTALEGLYRMRGEETFTARQLWDRAVRGEAPSASGHFWRLASAWSARHFNPDHPTVSTLVGSAVKAAAIFGGLVVDAATDPLTWAFCPMSGARTLLSPRQGAEAVRRAVVESVGRTVGRQEAETLARDLLQELRQYNIYYNHLGEERMSAGLGFYTVLRNRLAAMGVENAEVLAERATRRAVADLAPQVRFNGRPVFRRSPNGVELHPDIASDLAAARRRATGVPPEPEVVPAGRVGQRPPGVAPRPTVPVEVEVRPRTPPPSEPPTIPPREARPPVPAEESTVPRPEPPAPPRPRPEPRAEVPRPEAPAPRDFFEPEAPAPAPQAAERPPVARPVTPPERLIVPEAAPPRPRPEIAPEARTAPAAGVAPSLSDEQIRRRYKQIQSELAHEWEEVIARRKALEAQAQQAGSITDAAQAEYGKLYGRLKQIEDQQNQLRGLYNDGDYVPDIVEQAGKLGVDFYSRRSTPSISYWLETRHPIRTGAYVPRYETPAKGLNIDEVEKAGGVKIADASTDTWAVVTRAGDSWAVHGDLPDKTGLTLQDALEYAESELRRTSWKQPETSSAAAAAVPKQPPTRAAVSPPERLVAPEAAPPRPTPGIAPQAAPGPEAGVAEAPPAAGAGSTIARPGREADMTLAEWMKRPGLYSDPTGGLYILEKRIEATEEALAERNVARAYWYSEEGREVLPKAEQELLGDLDALKRAYDARVRELTPVRDPAEHREIVERALREGYPVPERVLADYPDLAAMAARGALPPAAEVAGPKRVGGRLPEEMPDLDVYPSEPIMLGGKYVTPAQQYELAQILQDLRSGGRPVHDLDKWIHSRLWQGKKQPGILVSPDMLMDFAQQGEIRYYGGRYHYHPVKPLKGKGRRLPFEEFRGGKKARIEEMLEEGETPPDLTARHPDQDLYDLVARVYERAGLPAGADEIRQVVGSLPKQERMRWRDAFAMMLPANLSRAWSDALVHSLYFPRSVTDGARAVAARALSALRNPEKATLLHALRSHRVRVSPAELARARAAVSLDLIPQGQNVWEWLSRHALPDEARRLIEDARAVWQGGEAGAAVRADPARYAAVQRFEQARVNLPPRRVTVSLEERLEAAYLAAGHGPESRDLARAAIVEGRINRAALPADVRQLLDEADLVSNLFRHLWDNLEIPAPEIVQGLRDFGVEVEALEPIAKGYVPQRGILPEWAVRAVGEDAAIFFHATEANVWDALVKAAVEGNRPNQTLALEVLVNSWLSNYEKALRHLTLLQTVRGDPLTSSLRFKPEPGLGRYVLKGSPEAEELAKRGWQLMTQSDGRTPLPGLETEEGVWLVPGPFARQYHIRSTLNSELLQFGALSAFLHRTRGVLVNFALLRVPFLRTNFLEQFLNLLMTFGPEGGAREAATVVNQVLRKVAGRPVAPEAASAWATGAKAAARVYLSEVLSSFQVAPPMTVLENLDRGVLTSVEKMVRAALPDATDEFVEMMRRELPSVRATGQVGQIRMLENEARRLVVPQFLRALGWTVDDLLHFSGRVWQGLEDALRTGGYVALRAMNYSPSGARRAIFQGFVGYMREMFPVLYGVLSNFAWFMRFPYGRQAQYISKALDRPVWLYVLAQSYDRQDRERAKSYGRKWKQWLLAANVARRKNEKLGLDWHPIPWEAVPEALLPTEDQLPLLGDGQTRVFFLRHRTPDETIWDVAAFLRNPYRGMERYLDPVLKAYIEAMESRLPLKERAVSAARELPGAGYFLGPRPITTPWLREKRRVDRENEDRIRRGERPLEMPERPEADEQLEEQLRYARLIALMSYFQWENVDIMDFTREELEEMLRLGDEQDRLHGRSAENWLWPRRTILDAIDAKKEGARVRPFGRGPYDEAELPVRRGARR